MKVRLTALSISSTHMKTMIALRRVSTPTTPIVNKTAEKNSASASNSPPWLAEHHGSDDRDEQQYAGDLEGQQIFVEQGPGNRRDRAALRDLARRVSLGDAELLCDCRSRQGEDLGEDRQPDRTGG